MIGDGTNPNARRQTWNWRFDSPLENIWRVLSDIGGVVRYRVAVVEIRRNDDERRMIPDRDNGFIRLYEAGSTPVFRYLSETDLMLHGMGRAARSSTK